MDAVVSAIAKSFDNLNILVLPYSPAVNPNATNPVDVESILNPTSALPITFNLILVPL